jgi:ribosomal protein S20
MSADDKTAAYPGLQSALDKAVSKGFIPKNRAARLKSNLTP